MTSERLVVAVQELAARAEPADVRAQLHALAGLLANLELPDPSRDAGALDAALTAGDEAAAIVAMRALAAADRARVVPVDWGAASHG